MEKLIDIGPEAFANEELTVISYKGDNYYRACDAQVLESAVGNSHCVLRVDHPSDYHEDFDGYTKFSPMRQCPGRHLHEKHTYKYSHLSNYVEGRCPGNDGTKP